MKMSVAFICTSIAFGGGGVPATLGGSVVEPVVKATERRVIHVAKSLHVAHGKRQYHFWKVSVSVLVYFGSTLRPQSRGITWQSLANTLATH